MTDISKGLKKMDSNQEKINELAAIYCLKRIKGLGPVKSRKIFEASNSFYDFCISYRNWLVHRDLDFKYQLFPRKFQERFENEFITNYNKFNQCRDFILTQLNKADHFGGNIITFHDDFYPKNLYHSNQSIPLLYVAGDLKILKKEKVCAVVGTRKPCNWTLRHTKLAVRRLVKEGYVIVSGLAKGVDTVAHQTALEYGGKTIAVLGSGIDIYYPSENKQLHNEIKHKGIILSEYPFGMKVQSFSLKKRNKIIVGLSKFVLITETSPKGGTMNAYLAAVEQKKPVGVFKPIEDVGGNFEGNEKIARDGKTKVKKFSSGDELEKL